MRGSSAHSLSVMVGRAISIQGLISPITLPKGQIINGGNYANRMLRDHHLPEIAAASRGKRFVSEQDQARPRSAQETVKWLGRHMKRHKLMQWPGKGADICPLDYGVWNQVQEKVWADKPKSLIELRVSALKHLTTYPNEAINNATQSFPKRLRALVAENRGFFEYEPDEGVGGGEKTRALRELRIPPPPPPNAES